MDLHDLIQKTALALEAVGVLVIVVAIAAACVRVAWRVFKEGWEGSFAHFRMLLGRGLLIGLEFLVAADIIMTVTETLVLSHVLSLALIVLIRTFLSVMLEIELEGRPPWGRHRVPSGQPSGAREVGDKRTGAARADGHQER